ncbi:MAG: hypothetical protein WBP61_12430 [Nocardioides sp.]
MAIPAATAAAHLVEDATPRDRRWRGRLRRVARLVRAAHDLRVPF